MDFLVGMMVSSAVCHFILHGDSKVIAATIFSMETFDFVVLALGKSNPIRLGLVGFTLNICQEVVSPLNGPVSFSD